MVKKEVNAIPPSLVVGIVPVSFEAILPVRSEKQYNQDVYTFIMQCIKKLSSPPINLECCESPERSNSSKGQSDGTREQTAHKLMGLL